MAPPLLLCRLPPGPCSQDTSSWWPDIPPQPGPARLRGCSQSPSPPVSQAPRTLAGLRGFRGGLSVSHTTLICIHTYARTQHSQTHKPHVCTHAALTNTNHMYARTQHSRERTHMHTPHTCAHTQHTHRNTQCHTPVHTQHAHAATRGALPDPSRSKGRQAAVQSFGSEMPLDPEGLQCPGSDPRGLGKGLSQGLKAGGPADGGRGEAPRA